MVCLLLVCPQPRLNRTEVWALGKVRLISLTGAVQDPCGLGYGGVVPIILWIADQPDQSLIALTAAHVDNTTA